MLRFLIILSSLIISAHLHGEQGRPNVLFIAIDDLRTELGCYGAKHIISPNIDKLAETGTRFERAYCMVPTCGASRASLMSGLRPTPNRFVTYTARMDASRNKRLPFGYFDVSDEKLPDGQVAEKAVETLRLLSMQESPFFLAVGFFKPHLPFNAPKKYWDLYDHNTIEIPDNYYPPKDAPEEAIHNFGELRNYAAVPTQGKVSDEMARALIHGYYACVSYTDAQVGRVLHELNSLGLSENTIVVLWGDHGWNLGEHTLWCKHCTFENAMKAPLIFRTPTANKFPKGNSAKTLAEFIDIYPTLTELAGLPTPIHVEGKSLVPILKSPSNKGKGYAIGRFRNGDTIRTDRWRYTEYSKTSESSEEHENPRMLYDHTTDPEENVNLAYNREYRSVIETMSKQLNQLKGR